MHHWWNRQTEAMKIAIFTSAVGLLGVLLGALLPYLLDLLARDGGSPPTSVPATKATASSTSVPPTTTADPLRVVVDSAGSLSYAVPDPPEKLVGAPSPFEGGGCRSQARLDWVAALGGVPTAQHEVSVVLQAIGKEERNIVITGVELHATRKPADNLKTHVRLCGGGGVPMQYLHFRLGDPRSQVQIYDEQMKPVDRLTLQLKQGEAARFLIVTTAVGPPGVIYEWSVDLIVIVDGERRLYRVADHGHPFRYATETKSWQLWTDLSGPTGGSSSTTIR